MVVMTRAGALRGYQALADELGGDGAALLDRFGITPAAIDSEVAVVSSEAVGWALEIAAAELSCPDFGLRLSDRQVGSTTGPLAMAVANAATVGAAIACASRYLFTHHTGVALRLVADPEHRPGMVAINFRDPGESNGFAQGIDLAAGTIHRALRHAVDGDYGLRSICLPHPPLAPAARYAEFFDAEVRFGADTTLLRIPAELLTRPIANSSATMYSVALHCLSEKPSELAESVAAQVRVAIEGLITSAKPDIEAIARRLSIHQRTLQRALAAEGTTFTEILDGARRDAAYRLLCETDMSMSRITNLIGLREQSAFTRAVRRWFGATPQQIRRAARARRGGEPRVVVRHRDSAVSFAKKPTDRVARD
ncbi:AraC family transcriptional regulator [Nocardia sp. CS682]|uniref:AraC family transcriptional regulator n=1 Tax=Nocardia sp. CS682 TaxID=1047172 RepID=UPI0010752B9A|nr:AraC family transcriptional regulator [Nocardia sp. CS682]QBS40606.1 AraC family transcriptional regulator [Nocardia sp. CS682]